MGEEQEAWAKFERRLQARLREHFRAGARVPHPRHWGRLASLTASRNAPGRPIG